MIVFDRFRGYGFVHHRALNSITALQEAVKVVNNNPDRDYILEGDICWDFTGGREDLYFRHPSYVIDTLAPDEIQRRFADNTLINFMDLASIIPEHAYVVVELKVGKGEFRAALRKIVAFLEDNFANRYWIDGFSLPMLEYIKSINPSTTVTLHTEFLYKQRVLLGAPEWPPLGIRKLSELHTIDGIAIRWHGTKQYMENACADVHAANKALLLSRLHNLNQFELSKQWGAKAGYMHWDYEELFAFNDEIDAKLLAASTNR